MKYVEILSKYLSYLLAETSKNSLNEKERKKFEAVIRETRLELLSLSV
jgi:hypothetical protein